jgi:hypothetical protein
MKRLIFLILLCVPAIAQVQINKGVQIGGDDVGGGGGHAPDNTVLAGPVLGTGANAARIQSAMAYTTATNGFTTSIMLPNVIAGDSIVVASSCSGLNAGVFSDSQSDVFIKDSSGDTITNDGISWGHVASTVGGNTTVTVTYTNTNDASCFAIGNDAPFLWAAEYTPIGTFETYATYSCIPISTLHVPTGICSTSLTTTSTNDLVIILGSYSGDTPHVSPTSVSILSPNFSPMGSLIYPPGLGSYSGFVVGDAGGGAAGSQSVTVAGSPAYYGVIYNVMLAYRVPVVAPSTGEPTYKAIQSYDPFGTAAALTVTPQTVSALWNFKAGDLQVGSVLPCLADGTGCGYVRGNLSLTTATSDTASITGVTTSSACTFSPSNSTAAAATVIAYVSAVTTNSVMITHAATTANGGTLNIICTTF